MLSHQLRRTGLEQPSVLEVLSLLAKSLEVTRCEDWIGVHDHHINACHREYLGDSATHVSGADDSDVLDHGIDPGCRSTAASDSRWCPARRVDRRSDDAVAELMVEYLTWAIERLARDYGVDEPPTHPALVRDGLAGYRRPSGKLVLAECDGKPAGVGAIRLLRTGVVEVKRMYVAPDCRERHVGSAILDRLLLEAREMGATTVLLDTCRFMTDAQRLYRSRGFVERSPVRRH